MKTRENGLDSRLGEELGGDDANTKQRTCAGNEAEDEVKEAAGRRER